MSLWTPGGNGGRWEALIAIWCLVIGGSLCWEDKNQLGRFFHYLMFLSTHKFFQLSNWTVLVKFRRSQFGGQTQHSAAMGAEQMDAIAYFHKRWMCNRYR